MSKLSATETLSDAGPECPYCGEKITPDEGFYYDACKYVEDECPECERKFKVEVNTTTTWFCEAIDARPDSATNGER